VLSSYLKARKTHGIILGISKLVEEIISCIPYVAFTSCDST
jgi:hypothetical protein